jgi:hypothetical protein
MNNKICSGVCSRSVLKDTSPETCSYCAEYKICDGVCKMMVYNTITPETCYNCYNINYPSIKCFNCTRVGVFKSSICSSCTIQQLIQSLITINGEINNDYVVKIKTHETIFDSTIFNTYYFPAFNKVLDDDINLGLYTKNFKIDKIVVTRNKPYYDISSLALLL